WRAWWVVDPALGSMPAAVRQWAADPAAKFKASSGRLPSIIPLPPEAVTAACFLDIPAKSEPGCLLTKALSFHRPPKPCTPAWSSQLQVKVTSAKSG
ncbi:Os02g0142060, partial [Oryza sativa Japonica Group]